MQGGRTPLHLAALQGKLGVMKQLLDARAPANSADENGMTPLHKAAVGGREQAAKALLDAGASLDARLKVIGVTVACVDRTVLVRRFGYGRQLQPQHTS